MSSVYRIRFVDRLTGSLDTKLSGVLKMQKDFFGGGLAVASSQRQRLLDRLVIYCSAV